MNYFTINTVDAIGGNGPSTIGSFPAYHKGLTVHQAYAIDSKIDDGYPTSGRALALFADGTPTWANMIQNIPPPTFATPQTGYTCFDNGNIAGAMQYSNRAGTSNYNCVISIRFQ